MVLDQVKEKKNIDSNILVIFSHSILLQRRIEANRNGYLPCIKHERESNENSIKFEKKLNEKCRDISKFQVSEFEAVDATGAPPSPSKILSSKNIFRNDWSQMDWLTELFDFYGKFRKPFLEWQL